MTPDDLLEIELIRQLKYKYARCLDLKLWDELATTLTDDVIVDYSGGSHRLLSSHRCRTTSGEGSRRAGRATCESSCPASAPHDLSMQCCKE